jgi:hypothetical protein
MFYNNNIWQVMAKYANIGYQNWKRKAWVQLENMELWRCGFNMQNKE